MENDLKTVLEWRARARRGDVRKMATLLGVSDQVVTNTVADARRGVLTGRVARLAEAIRRLEQYGVRSLDDVLRPSTTPTVLDDLVDDAVLASGHSAAEVLEYVRRRFPAIRNFVDSREYVFARVDRGNGNGGSS